MSEPKRYSVASLPPVIVEDENGYFVRWEDYAVLKHKLNRLLGAEQEWVLVEPEHYDSLKADCEKWRAINIRLLMQQVELGNESISLKAEVERLRIEVKRLTTALKTCDRILKPLRDKAQKQNEAQ